MYKLIIQSLLLATIAFPVNAANDLFDCERKVYSTIGFKDSADMDNFYPKKLQIVIAENKSWAASYYGVHRNRANSARKNDVVRTKNGFRIDGRKLRSDGEIFVTYYKQGFKQPIPARYQCGKGKKTSWKPAD